MNKFGKAVINEFTSQRNTNNLRHELLKQFNDKYGPCANITHIVTNNFTDLMGNYVSRFQEDLKYWGVRNQDVNSQVSMINARFISEKLPFLHEMSKQASDGWGGIQPEMAYTWNDGFTTSNRTIVADARREIVKDTNTHESVYEDLLQPYDHTSDGILKSWKYPTRPRELRDDSVGAINLRADAPSASQTDANGEIKGVKYLGVKPLWGDGGYTLPLKAPIEVRGRDRIMGVNNDVHLPPYASVHIRDKRVPNHHEMFSNKELNKKEQFMGQNGVSNNNSQNEQRDEQGGLFTDYIMSTGDIGTRGNVGYKPQCTQMETDRNTPGRPLNGVGNVYFGGESYQGTDVEDATNTGLWAEPRLHAETMQHYRQLLDAPYIHMLNSGSNPVMLPDQKSTEGNWSLKGPDLEPPCVVNPVNNCEVKQGKCGFSKFDTSRDARSLQPAARKLVASMPSVKLNPMLKLKENVSDVKNPFPSVYSKSDLTKDYKIRESFGNRQLSKDSFSNKQLSKDSFGNKQWVHKDSFGCESSTKQSSTTKKDSFGNKSKTKESFSTGDALKNHQVDLKITPQVYSFPKFQGGAARPGNLLTGNLPGAIYEGGGLNGYISTCKTLPAHRSAEDILFNDGTDIDEVSLNPDGSIRRQPQTIANAATSMTYASGKFREQNRPMFSVNGSGFANQDNPQEMQRLLQRRSFRVYRDAMIDGPSVMNPMAVSGKKNVQTDDCQDLGIFWSGEIYNDQIPFWQKSLHTRRYDYDAEEAVGGFEFGYKQRGYDMDTLKCRVDSEQRSRNLYPINRMR